MRTRCVSFAALVLFLAAAGAAQTQKPASTDQPAATGKVELSLEEDRRQFAPDEPIPLRLANGSSRTLFLVVERRSGLRTEQGRSFPGVPVHERRKRKFFWRSDRWVYTSGGQARFLGALLRPGDAIRFASSIPKPAKYRIHVRYWWMETPDQEKEFLKLDVKALEKEYTRQARWVDTPTFRVKKPPAADAR